MPTDLRRTTTPISTAARIRLRGLWAAVGVDAARVERAVAETPPELLRDIRRCFTKGAQRAVERLHRRLSIERVHTAPRAAVWRFLRPGPADEPPAVQVAAVILDVAARPALQIEPFGFAASHHALGRLLDRSGGTADPAAAVLEAHSALLRLQADEGERLFQLPQIVLPAAGGLLLASPRPGAIRAVALTWIDRDQLGADQERAAADWSELLRLAS